MFRKKQSVAAAAAQLRGGTQSPFGAGLPAVPPGEAQLYRAMRQSLPVLDAAIGKLVRLSGGFTVRSAQQQAALNAFLRTVPCGRGQTGIHSFLSAYLDSLLTYGRAVGEMLVAQGDLRAVCWGDVNALERMRDYNGLYHVLGGVISPMQGISPSDLKIDLLCERIARGGVKEVILAISTSVEGETTLFYLMNRLRQFPGLKVTSIARGIGFGDELEYVDELTITHALMNRREIEWPARSGGGF
mgnify:CR=1 FL=1